jgi:hypothetical protein
MATRKKPDSTIDQIVSLLREMVTEPMTDQSSIPPTAADVRRARSAMGVSAPRKKKPTKARARPAARKKRAATRKKTTVKRAPREKAARKKPSKRR